MTYKNKFQNSPLTNLKLAMRTSSPFPMFVFVLTTVIYVALSVFGTMSEKGSMKLVFAIAFFFLVTVLLTTWTMLNAAPNEKSVTFGSDSLTIDFPLLKKSRTIFFRDIICIHASRTSDKQEALIRIKSQGNNFGLKEDYETITSLEPRDWKEIAVKEQLPLIIHSDIEERVKVKWGIFGPSYLSGDDTYVIKRSFVSEGERIALPVWNDYSSKNTDISFLGVEEFTNVTNDIQKEPRHQYSLRTDFGIKTLDYFEGRLLATYEKGKAPQQIEKIAVDLKLEFKNIFDIK